MDAKTNEEQGKPNGFALGQLLYDRMHGLEKVECERCAELEQALAESLKLQSHYAALLNQYDGGERIIFGGANEFLERLAALKGEGS